MPRYPVEPVAIEYDCYNKRVTKTFSDMYAARRFYVLKDKQGKHPKVLKVPPVKGCAQISGDE